MNKEAAKFRSIFSRGTMRFGIFSHRRTSPSSRRSQSKERVAQGILNLDIVKLIVEVCNQYVLLIKVCTHLPAVPYVSPELLEPFAQQQQQVYQYYSATSKSDSHLTYIGKELTCF
jgi:hypothetical protein